MYQKMAKKKKTTRYTKKIPMMMYRSRVLRADIKKSAVAAVPIKQLEECLEFGYEHSIRYYTRTGGTPHCCEGWDATHLESTHV